MKSGWPFVIVTTPSSMIGAIREGLQRRFHSCQTYRAVPVDL